MTRHVRFLIKQCDMTAEQAKEHARALTKQQVKLNIIMMHHAYNKIIASIRKCFS